jgi:5-methylcytosine-specific restriction enzyme subunit McrC
VYDLDHQLHQVLAHALDIVGQFSKGTNLNDQLRRLQLSFPQVKQIKPNAQTLSALKIDRKTAPYERAFELAKFIILNYSPDINYGRQKMISLLFDMNQLWEEYVFVMLRKEVNSLDSPYADYSVHPQASKQFWNNNSLQPDILIEHKPTGRKYIIDTKWKRPGFSASIQDLRQVYAYARFWDAEHVMLLYPGVADQNQHDEFNTKDVVEHQEELISHSGFLRFVQVVGEGRLHQAIGKDIFAGFVKG